MGFEYKLIAKFTEKQIVYIKQLLETHKEFHSTYPFNDKTIWELKQRNNKGKMPNVSLNFETDGIYICQHGEQNVWVNLQELKTYIKTEQIEYKILDFQE